MFVGEDKQEIRAIFDTGSANAWILSSACRNAQTLAQHHHFFDPSHSQTFVDTEQEAKIFFGSGMLSGTFGKDQFWVTNSDGREIHVKN